MKNKPNFWPASLLTFLLLALATVQLQAQSNSQEDYNRILSAFNTWKAKQIADGKFADERKCNPDTVLRAGYKGPEVGIPREIDISFSDLNHDNIVDGLVTFFVDQCNEGNGLMNVQVQLLVLSKGDDYCIEEGYFQKINSSLKKGWLIIENASYGRIYGSYHDYKKGDGQCCPSISKSFSVVYPRVKLEYGK